MQSDDLLETLIAKLELLRFLLNEGGSADSAKVLAAAKQCFDFDLRAMRTSARNAALVALGLTPITAFLFYLHAIPSAAKPETDGPMVIDQLVTNQSFTEFMVLPLAIVSGLLLVSALVYCVKYVHAISRLKKALRFLDEDPQTTDFQRTLLVDKLVALKLIAPRLETISPAAAL